MKPPDLSAVRKRIDAQRAHGQRMAEGLLLKIHRELYVRSGGRIGEKVLGVPSMLLTVTGRKTGDKHTVALVHVADESSYVVVASNGGGDRNPAWFDNLSANPAVGVQIGVTRFDATAEVVDQNDRRYERLWRLVNTNNKGRYYRYQHETRRPIPLVILSPA